MTSLPITDIDHARFLADSRTLHYASDAVPPHALNLAMPVGPGTWLLSKFYPEKSDCAFALCNFSPGAFEFGYVLLAELATIHGCLRLPIEHDASVRPDRPPALLRI